MSYRTFIVDNEPLEALGRLWGFYSMKRAKITEEGNGTNTIYPKGIVGDAEAHAYFPKNQSHLKIMLVGEIEDIDNTKKNY